jgi:DNA-binding winged helix-turn-helix (wHTH) protein
MASRRYRFDHFELDAADRQLRGGGVPVDLNARYLDALLLLVSAPGQLVTKDRFFAEVWRGVPVTDDALTQCIATLRRQLGDSASRPRFIETVPKHGYRFIAPVDLSEARGEGAAEAMRPPGRPALAWQPFLIIGVAGTGGAAVAGILGGIVYGLAGAAPPGMGAASVLLVLVCLTLLIALLGGAGVAFGIAAADLAARRGWGWNVIGGGLGGLLVGAIVKLIGLDAFDLLFGHAPGDITGAPEGALLGAALGLGAWIGGRGAASLPRGLLAGGAAGGLAGGAIAGLGGQMLGGSLDLLARSFPGSRLQLDRIGALVGEPGFGPVSQLVTGSLEGALFGACVVGAMNLTRLRLGRAESVG